MKQILLSILMTMMLLPTMVSCSKGNEEEPKIYATESEIQGVWCRFGEKRSLYFEFDKNYYLMMNKNGKDFEYESGRYSFGENGTIELHPYSGGKSPWSPIIAYWEGSSKNSLHLWPHGIFDRYK